MGQAGQGGGCLAWLFWGGQGRVGHRTLQTPHLLSWGSAKAGLACPVAGLQGGWKPGWQFSCVMLMRAVAGEEGEAMLLSCTCPCWRVLRETRGPPQIQVAKISLPSLTLLAPSALGVWTGIGEGRRSKSGPVPPPHPPCFPGSILIKIKLV